MTYSELDFNGIVPLSDNIIYDSESGDFIITVGNVSIALDSEEFVLLVNEITQASKSLEKILMKKPKKITGSQVEN